MATYSTPGVYVEEIATLAPSVAQVATAIPVFIGYTEKGYDADKGPVPVRIDALLDYETQFGKAKSSTFTVAVTDYGKSTQTLATTRTDASSNKFLMYYSVSLYFRNGGSSCYIISVGNYTASSIDKTNFSNGLGALEKEDEPTLIVLVDAVGLSANKDYYDLCQQALSQCKKLGDRFLILDVVDTVDKFRGDIGTENLSYGAAYYPYLNTLLTYQYEESGVTVSGTTTTTEAAAGDEAAETTTASITMADIRTQDTSLYNQIKTELSNQRITLPPSSALAGIYVQVDGSRGVWKTPANVSIQSIVGPVKKISDTDQGGMNVDPTTGKSVNAIRDFTGKGTLVWGGRTLAGNDNEWRYISVRRLFITIEESIKKATAFAVFEPNDTTTWLKVKAMSESYLYGLWQQGALAGSKPESAYYVNVGLGKTMTDSDIQEGRMIVEIGVAAVRPAEFIVLRFYHKVQEA